MHPQDRGSMSWQWEGMGDGILYLLPILQEPEMTSPVMSSLMHVILPDTGINRSPGVNVHCSPGKVLVTSSAALSWNSNNYTNKLAF